MKKTSVFSPVAFKRTVNVIGFALRKNRPADYGTGGREINSVKLWHVDENEGI